VSEESVASGVTDVHDTLLGHAGEREKLDLVLGEDGIEHRLALGVEVFGTDDVDLVDDDEGGLVGEEGLDRLVELALWKEEELALEKRATSEKETNLSLDGEAALLGKVHEVHDTGAEVSKSGDGLHLDGVHLLEGVVKNSGSVDNLPAEVLVIHVSDEERLGGEGVGLDVDVGASDLVDEGRLSDVGVTADKERTGGGVDGRETGHVLANLLEVSEGILLTLHDGGHATEGSLLELLATVERVTELEETAVVLSDLNDEVTSGVELTERELVVILVVEDVEEGGKERVEVL
jgi:hypothetical protein